MHEHITRDNKRYSHLRSSLRFALFCWLFSCIAMLCHAHALAVTGILLLMANGIGLFLVLDKGWHATCLAALSSMTVGLITLFVYAASIEMQSELTLWIALPLISAFVTFVIYNSWQDRLKLHTDWQCQQCGYTLLNLTTSTCPECGKGFNTQIITASKEAHDQMFKIKLLGW